MLNVPGWTLPSTRASIAARTRVDVHAALTEHHHNPEDEAVTSDNIEASAVTSGGRREALDCHT